jgi:multiple sugar transport system permease protein
MEKTVIWSKQERLFPYIAISPTVVLIVLVGLVPAIYTFLLSLQEYELIKPPAQFIGLANYVDLLLHNPRYLRALAFTIVFALVATTLELIVGFFIAYLLADKEVSEKYSSFIRTLIMVPFVVAPVVVSYTFKTLIYDQTFGYLNYFLRLLHLPEFDIFQGAINAPIGILVMEVILRTPFIAIVLYAGISSIDPSILDAAAIDGASWFKRLTKVVIPTIQPIIVVAYVLRFMDALKMFDEIYVVTGGGPGYVTENVSVFTVKQAFEYFHMGYAAASAFVFLVVVMILVSLLMKMAKFS